MQPCSTYFGIINIVQEVLYRNGQDLMELHYILQLAHDKTHFPLFFNYELFGKVDFKHYQQKEMVTAVADKMNRMRNNFWTYST